MTYACTLANQAGTTSVNFDKTYNEGSGPQYSYVNDVAVLEAPTDASGNTQASAMDLKYTQETIIIQGQFKDGLGDADWTTPGSTKFEKLLKLAKTEILPLVLTWPTTKTWYCIVTRLNANEQGGYGNTITYDISLRIVANS